MNKEQAAKELYKPNTYRSYRECFTGGFNLGADWQEQNAMRWVTERPDFKEECLLIVGNLFRGEWEYEIYQIKMVDFDEFTYMGWLTGDGDEYGDLKDLQADKYMTLPLLKPQTTK